MARLLLPLLLVLIFLFQSGIAGAAGFSLEAEKDAYGPGDTIIITVELFNTYDYEVDFVMELSMTSEAEMLPDTLISHPGTMGPHESKVVTVYEQYVTDDFPAGRYLARGTLVVDNIIRGESEITYVVEGTLQTLGFEIQLSKDNRGEHDSRVFLLGDEIYLDYNSPVAGIEVTAGIAFPDESAEVTELPSVLELSQEGAYVLTATASKEGYKSEEREIHFSVIAEQPNIPLRDAPVTAAEAEGLRWWWIMIGVLCGIALVVAGLVIFKQRQRKESS
jgi:hypothetical protein